MAKAKNKTQPTGQRAKDFLNTVADEQQRADSFRVLEMMQRITGEQPRMWGPAIIGFGLRHLKYDSGREMDWMITGFSPRKGNLALYGVLGAGVEAEQLDQLGKHSSGKGCLYIKKLSDIDENILEQMIASSFKDTSDNSSGG